MNPTAAKSSVSIIAAVRLPGDKWLPIAQQILARWDVKHESLKGTIASEIAGIVAEERERCAKIAEAIDSGRGNEKEIARAIRAAST